MVAQNIAEAQDSEVFIQEAMANFNALLEDAEFTPELELLGVKRLQFMRRRQMLTELRGLYIALWRLALASSFPDAADSMFAIFLENFMLNHPDKISAQVVKRAWEYWGMLQAKGDSDFSEVARHLCSFGVPEGAALRPLVLGLVLHIRQSYKFIFDRLI